MPELRILIADDHAVLRRSIRSLLESHAQWSVCGEAADGEEAVEEAERLRPDVVLLDISMPKLNGLEAARRIRQSVPTAQFLVLTMHSSDQLPEEARRAGARDVVMKSDADRSLIGAIESLRAPDRAIPLAGSVIRQWRHIAAFFHSEEERYRVLAPFIADGLAVGEKAIHIIDPPDRDRHVRRLTEAGIDVAGAEARHQLVLIPWEEAFPRNGGFDQDGVSLFRQILSDGVAEGYPLTRVIGHTDCWAAQDRRAVLVAREERLNGALAERNDVVICAYDLTKFTGAVIVDVLRSHPMTIVGGSLRENPFYAPADR
jgi:DNA-binding NarL/FixJ family response regulator